MEPTGNSQPAMLGQFKRLFQFHVISILRGSWVTVIPSLCSQPTNHVRSEENVMSTSSLLHCSSNIFGGPIATTFEAWKIARPPPPSALQAGEMPTDRPDRRQVHHHAHQETGHRQTKRNVGMDVRMYIKTVRPCELSRYCN